MVIVKPNLVLRSNKVCIGKLPAGKLFPKIIITSHLLQDVIQGTRSLLVMVGSGGAGDHVSETVEMCGRVL
jgi:hypothetical protein